MATESQEEKDYWSLLQSSQTQFYPEFVNHLSTQNGIMAEDGKAAVIEFHDGHAKPWIKDFSASRKLRDYLNDTPSGAAHPRAFVLQGLPRNFVQVLGAKLRVPPSFFAAHWLSPDAYIGNLLNRTPRHHDNRRRCILSFRRLHQASIKEEDDGETLDRVYHMETSTRRPVSRRTVFGDYDGPLSSSEQLSFWSSAEGDSWDAVVLVDPPLGDFVRWKNAERPRQVEHSDSSRLAEGISDGMSQKGSWYPPYSLDAALTPTPAEWQATSDSPGMRCFFDDIKLLSQFPSSHSAARPMDTLRICRRIVLMAWMAWLRVTEAQIIQEQVEMYKGPKDSTTSSASWMDKSFILPWEQRRFNRLMRAKTKLVALDAELYRNMDALGMLAIDKSGFEAWEAEAWRALQRGVEMLKARMEIISQAYTQTVTVRETMTAVEQARHVGLLTNLATLFIPISFVAAIFSIGGEYAVGKRLFWAYWVIAVPVVAFGCFLLFTRHGGSREETQVRLHGKGRFAVGKKKKTEKR